MTSKTQPDTPTAANGGAASWRPYALLTLAYVFFALNIVVGRAAHELIPPVGLSFWRWTLASVILLPFAWRHVRDQKALLLANWRRLAGLSLLLIAFGNTLLYVGLQDTTALNGGLIQVIRPVIILILSWLVFRGMVTRFQWLGVAIALVGVLVVITRGDSDVLSGLRLNTGDLWVVASSIGIAGYQVSFARVTTDIHPIALLQTTITIGAVLLLPAYLIETHVARPVTVTWPALGAILYVAIFPSIASVYLMNAGIRAIGPARAGIFSYLPPILIAAIAIPALGETVDWCYPVALVLVLGGIYISSRVRRS